MDKQSFESKKINIIQTIKSKRFSIKTVKEEIHNQVLLKEKLARRKKKFEKFIGVIQVNQKLKEMNQEVQFKYDKL